MERKYHDEDWLFEQYVEKQRSSTDIANECGCSSSAILKWLKKHGIERRAPPRELADERLSDPDWLRNEYIGQQNTISGIADKCDCSRRTVAKWLDRHDIDTRETGRQGQYPRLENKGWLRSHYIDKEQSVIDIAEKCGSGKTTVVRWLDKHGIETRSNTPDVPDERLKNERWLREQYLRQEKSTMDIAKQCDCSSSTVVRWFQEHNIETRIDYPSGENHPGWKGGKQNYGRGWNRKKRQSVRERDGFKCRSGDCSVTQEQHLNKYGEKLHVHHLRKARDVNDPERRNAKENLITLCRDCHYRWERLSDAGIVPQIVSD